jgi:phosphoribosylanthranilate isomerase
MSVWIKICGNTSLADARLAVDAGADAVGFVFAPSPRNVTVSEAAAIISHLPETVEKIGVFVDASLEEIYSTVRASGLTGVQLHFEAGAEMPAKLRSRLGPGIRILRMVHFDLANAMLVSHRVAAFAGDPNLDGVLVDSRTSAAVGGTGVAFDWTEARKTVFGDESKLKLIAAGGLTPENVAEAVTTLRPWGVDVVSGVEAAPGRKDAFKVHEFVWRARAVPQPFGSVVSPVSNARPGAPRV